MKGRQAGAAFFNEAGGLFENTFVMVVKTENHRGFEHDAGIADTLYQLLLRVPTACFRMCGMCPGDGLDSYENTDTT